MMGLGAQGDGWVINRGEDGYPRMLEDLSDPPARIYGRGRLSALVEPCFAIVGTRRITPYGAALCELAAKLAVESGLTVVSGGAIGCDQVAGRAALDAGGVHIVVLGTGADVVYPARSGPLIELALARGGAVISLEPWGMGPRRYAFPKRNRVIAALSQAVFVAEAGMPSGTFSTAEVAGAIGRELLVAPGSVFSAESRGTNYLIEAGATIIPDEEALSCAISRIYETLRTQALGHTKPVGATAEEREAIRVLTATPLRADEVARALSLDTRACLELLSALSVQSLVERTVDGRYAASSIALAARTSFGAQ